MINKVTLIGNLGKDAEFKTLESGAKVTTFSMATNKSYKDKAGEWQNVPSWHRIVCWNALAERTESLKKGTLVFVEGEITYKEYTDKDQVKRYATNIVAYKVRAIEKKENAHVDESQAEIYANDNVGEAAEFTPKKLDDDLPF